MAAFVGRTAELQLFGDLLQKNTASLVVLYGRRRIGKSSLVAEFGRKQPRFISFTGLLPRKGMSTATQLQEFARQMQRKLSLKEQNFSDWGEAFDALAQQVKTGRFIVLLDEISWMGSYDADFLGKLKNAWDESFKHNDKLILILCGSVSAWVEKNILASTGFYGRISLKINLHELSIDDCSRFWSLQNNHLSAYEQLKILSVTGGVPKYLEEIKPQKTAEENIKQLCFSETGLLYNDYDYIFSALLQRDSRYYQKIVELLSNGSLEQADIFAELKTISGGVVSEILNELLASGFVTRDYTWHLKSGVISQLSKYRLSDNYLRFYLKYIRPNIEKIKNNQFKACSLHALPGWSAIMGFQIENLVLNNREKLRQQLGIYPTDIVCDGPFFQRKTAKQKGCQIDYMVQTTLGIVFLCEIKFSRHAIGMAVIEEVKQKIDRLSIPRNVAVKPVLIHASEVHDTVIDSQFFLKIINLCDLFC